MSRDFEKEYLELINEEIPDLWDRIEAGLGERTAPEIEKTNKVKPVIVWKKYAGLAAAVLCVAIVIPVFVMIRQVGKSASFEAATEAPAEAGQTMEECVAEDAVAAEEESAEAASVMTMEDGADNRGEALREAEKIYDAASMPEVSCAAAGAEDLKDEAWAERKEEAFLLENVTVQVTEEKNVDAGKEDKKEGSNGGMVYTAIVVSDPSGTFPDDEQIEIYIPAVSPFVMTVGDAFEVDLIYDREKEYPLTAEQVRTEPDME